MKKPFHFIVGLFLLGGVATMAYLSLGVGTPWQKSSGLTLLAAFDSASGVKIGNRVEVAGVPVGRVADITLDTENSQALVHMDFFSKMDVHDDTIASVRTAGLIGETYISLQPGASGIILEDGEVLYDTEPATNIGELISRVAFGSIQDKTTSETNDHEENSE